MKIKSEFERRYTLRATRKYFVNGAYNTDERIEYLYQDIDDLGIWLQTIDLRCGGNKCTVQQAWEFMSLTRYYVKHNGFIEDWFYTRSNADQYILDNKAPIEKWPGCRDWEIIEDRPVCYSR